MCDLLHHQSGPEVEIETFRGDPLEYHYFISVFIGVSLLFLDHPVISLQFPIKLATHNKTSSLVSASFKMVFLFQNTSYQICALYSITRKMVIHISKSRNFEPRKRDLHKS